MPNSKTTSVQLAQTIETFHAKEYTLFISQIGYAHPGQMKVLFDQPDLTSQVSSDLRPILLAGRAKIACLEGNLHIASRLFDEAFKAAREQLKPGEKLLLKTEQLMAT